MVTLNITLHALINKNTTSSQLPHKGYAGSLMEQFTESTGIDANTIFTVAITFFIFGLGILINWVINVIKSRNERRNYVRTVNFLLFSLCKECQRQEKLIMESLPQTSVLTNKTIAIKLNVLSSIRFLDKMDYSVFVKHYVNGSNMELKTKATAKVFGILGHASIIESDTEEKLNYFIGILNRPQEEYVNNIITIENFQPELRPENMVDFEFKYQCEEIIQNWLENKKTNDFEPSYNQLIDPLFRLVRKFPNEPLSQQLDRLVNICRRAYSDIYHVDKNIHEHFIELARSNRNIYRTILAALKVYRFKDEKHWKTKKKR